MNSAKRFCLTHFEDMQPRGCKECYDWFRVEFQLEQQATGRFCEHIDDPRPDTCHFCRGIVFRGLQVAIQSLEPRREMQSSYTSYSSGIDALDSWGNDLADFEEVLSSPAPPQEKRKRKGKVSVDLLSEDGPSEYIIWRESDEISNTPLSGAALSGAEKAGTPNPLLKGAQALHREAIIQSEAALTGHSTSFLQEFVRAKGGLLPLPSPASLYSASVRPPASLAKPRSKKTKSAPVTSDVIRAACTNCILKGKRAIVSCCYGKVPGDCSSCVKDGLTTINPCRSEGLYACRGEKSDVAVASTEGGLADQQPGTGPNVIKVDDNNDEVMGMLEGNNNSSTITSNNGKASKSVPSSEIKPVVEDDVVMAEIDDDEAMPENNDDTTANTIDEVTDTMNCICNWNVDSGPTIYCEKCRTWQHIECYYPDCVSDAQREGFEHSCVDCKPDVMKCICDDNVNDCPTVYCERCDTWQHIACYYPDRPIKKMKNLFAGAVEARENLDLEHECVDCKPRAVDRQRAKKLRRGKVNGGKKVKRSHKKK